MAKIYGALGYGITGEVDPVNRPGVWVDSIIEREFYGELIKNSRRLEKSDGVNDNINISNQVSLLADPFAMANFQYIKFVKLMGTAWKVNTVEVQYPRLILTLGGLYNNGESN